MAAIITRMVQGKARDGAIAPPAPEARGSIVPPALLCFVVLVLGLYIPPALIGLLMEAAQLLGGH
jgi:hypothetical protein